MWAVAAAHGESRFARVVQMSLSRSVKARDRPRVIRVLVVVALVGCVEPSERVVQQDVTAAVKRQRSELIRDSAAEMGVHNAALG